VGAVREKQYKTQIKKWCLDTKYIKSSEYLAMIKLKRRRERENPPKETSFTLRGRLIDPRDVVRFEKRAIKKGLITPSGSLSGHGQLNTCLFTTGYLTSSLSQTNSRITDKLFFSRIYRRSRIRDTLTLGFCISLRLFNR